jgi:hypothetical protein
MALWRFSARLADRCVLVFVGFLSHADHTNVFSELTSWWRWCSIFWFSLKFLVELNQRRRISYGWSRLQWGFLIECSIFLYQVLCDCNTIPSVNLNGVFVILNFRSRGNIQ